jgi:stage II sporulation protein E
LIEAVFSVEETKVRQFRARLGEALSSPYARKAVIQVAGFFGGLLCSRGLVFGKYSPFGVALAASVPREGLWAAVMGAFFGYLLPSATYIPVRYEAALLAVAAIRWSLSELKGVNSHVLFAPVVAFLPLLLTGMTMVFLNGSLSYTAALYVAESFLGSGCAYFLRRTGNLLLGLTGDGKSKSAGIYDSGDVAALTVSVGVVVLAFSGVTFGGVSLGRILMVLLVLYCARLGGISGGTVAGVAAGVIQGLSTAGLSYLSGAYGLGGLMAGVFSPMGKIATAVAFILSHGVASMQVGTSSQATILRGAVEVGAATILYMAIPKSQRIAQLFGVRKDTLSGGALRGNIVLRLRHAAEALSQVHTSVEEISQKLSAVCAPSLQGVYDRSVEAICAGCSARGVCWRKHKEETLRNFSKLTKSLREKGRVDTLDFTPEFSDRCGRSGEMRDEINKNYGRYLLKEAAELRAAQIREVVEEHFQTTADILDEMAGEFSQYQNFDEEAAQRVAQILRENGIEPLEVCCRLDRFGRMTVEAEVSKERQKRLNRAVFTREISAACGRVFSPPCVSAAGENCRLQMCQRPAYDVARGFSQYSAKNGAFCGDSASVFYDGCGRLVAVLSDGMGTGGRAAVDGAMTCAMAESLLKAGIGFDSMLQTVNSALIAKSGDESLATLDIACIDLFSGRAEFLKAGAACTILRRGRKSEIIEASSVPVGIMPQVEFAAYHRDLSPGDVMVLVSDGVTASGQEWLEDMVLHWDEEENPNLLAQRIIDEAKKRRSDGHEDDITALALVLK